MDTVKNAYFIIIIIIMIIIIIISIFKEVVTGTIFNAFGMALPEFGPLAPESDDQPLGHRASGSPRLITIYQEII